MTVDLAFNIAYDGSATDTLKNFNNVNGSSFDDAIAPNNNSDVLDGLGGNNTVSFYAAPQGVNVNLATGIAIDGSATDTLRNFDRVIGSSFNDTLTAGTGNDTLTGNGGSDTFAFGQTFGSDIITDFSPAADLIDFNHNDFANFAAVQSHAQQSSANVVITSPAPGGSLTLDNLQLSALHAANFAFV